MNAQERGICSAYTNLEKKAIAHWNKCPFNLDKIPYPCNNIKHTKAGICPHCNIKFVRWVQLDSNNKIIDEILLPSFEDNINK